MTESDSRYFIRQATLDDAGQLAAVHVESWQEAYRDILPKDFLGRLSVDHRVEGWKRNLTKRDHLVLVGTDGDDRIVGFCDAGANRAEPSEFLGEVYAIYLLARAHGQGLGRALFQEAIEWLKRTGRSTFLVWVLSENTGARRFYEAVGGTAVGEKSIELAGTTHIEVAYGWRER